jgi:endonuclease/exonuclease/phosphatase family metal-dependent hydrolase
MLYAARALCCLVWGCSSPAPESKPTIARDSPPGTIDEVSALAEARARVAPPEPRTSPSARVHATKLKIATFNIQIFGKTKAGKPVIVRQLAAIVRRYDLVVVQEVKDRSGRAPQVLLDAVNHEGRAYAFVLSPESGRQDDDARSQERYLVYYDSGTVEALPGDRLYDDSAQDRFQREPYLTNFRSRRGDFSFVLINIHTRPEAAVAEIDALTPVFDWATQTFGGERNVIALGDFNASCTYARTAQLDALSIRGAGYIWIVPDSSDSNVATKSACAYDRIVTTLDAAAAFTGHWGVDQAFTDKKVSDHWPVWAEFAARDTR